MSDTFLYFTKVELLHLVFNKSNNPLISLMFNIIQILLCCRDFGRDVIIGKVEQVENDMGKIHDQ